MPSGFRFQLSESPLQPRYKLGKQYHIRAPVLLGGSVASSNAAITIRMF